MVQKTQESVHNVHFLAAIGCWRCDDDDDDDGENKADKDDEDNHDEDDNQGCSSSHWNINRELCSFVTHLKKTTLPVTPSCCQDLVYSCCHPIKLDGEKKHKHDILNTKQRGTPACERRQLRTTLNREASPCLFGIICILI